MKHFSLFVRTILLGVFLNFSLSTLLFSQEVLDVNLLQGPVKNHGLWFGVDNLYGLEYFNESQGEFLPLPIIGSLWFGAKDPVGNLKVAASTYGFSSNNTDFFPGPLDPETGTMVENAADWTKQFVVTDDDIQPFLDDVYDNGSVDNPIPLNILGWPGRGNPYFYTRHGFEIPNTSQGMAPFIDANGDEQYNPMDGDYPDIKGAAKAIWWVVNDAGGVHTETNGDPLQLEIQLMAYAYDSGSWTNLHTHYYDVKIINRGIESLEEMYASLWIDADIGGNNSIGNEKFGCSPEDDVAFYWNDGTMFNENQGVMATVKLIKTPLGPRVLNEDGAWVYPELGQNPDTIVESGLTSFMEYHRSNSGQLPPHTTDPTNALEYYHYMDGLYRDGSVPIRNDEPITHFYPGNPANPDDWTMCDDEPGFGDRRTLMNMGKLRHDPGSVNLFTFAISVFQGLDVECPNVESILEELDNLGEFTINTDDELSAATHETKILVTPNPAQHTVRFESDHSQIQSCYLYNANGVLLAQKEADADFVEFPVMDFPSGIYFYQIHTFNKTIHTGKWLKQ